MWTNKAIRTSTSAHGDDGTSEFAVAAALYMLVPTPLIMVTVNVVEGRGCQV